MAKLALVGQARYGNTRKIANELEKGGWSVEVFDAGHPKKIQARVPETVQLVLMITTHLPNNLTQRLKDAARAAKVKFLEVSPDWSGTYLLLQKYGLYPAPNTSIIKDLAPKVVEVEASFTSRPTNGIVRRDKTLTQRPFEHLDEKLKKEENVQSAAPVVQAAPAPAPAAPESEEKRSALDLANEARTKVMLEKQAMAREVLKLSPHASTDDVQGIIAKKHGGTLDQRRLKEARDEVWKQLGITGPAPTPAKHALSSSTRVERHEMAEELITANIEITFRECHSKVKERFGAGLDEEVFERMVEKEKKRRINAKVPVSPVVQLVPEPPMETKAEQPSEPAAMEAAVTAPTKTTSPRAYTDMEREDAIRLTKEALVGSNFKSLTFIRQPDGTYAVDSEEEEVIVKVRKRTF